MDVATAEPGRATHDCRGGLFCVVDLAVLGSLRSAEGTGLGLLAALAFGAVALAVLLRVQALRLRQRRISSVAGACMVLLLTLAALNVYFIRAIAEAV